MTPQEKLYRLQNPICSYDYGLSVSDAELRTFPEGRKILLEIAIQKRQYLKLKRHMKSMMGAMLNAKAQIVNNILKES